MIQRLALAVTAVAMTIPCMATPARAQTPTPAPATTTAAPDAAKLAKAEQLFTVMRLDQTYAQMTNQLMASIRSSEAQMMPQDTQTSAQKTEQSAFEAKLMTVVMGELSWQKLEPDFAKLYADAYTTEQLDGLIAFYGSPLGQTVLGKTPDLLRQSSLISQQHLAVILPQIQKMVQDEAAKLKASDGKATDPSQSK
jgi:hypothetical protein